MKDNYFIIHGSFSDPYSNWFSWLSEYEFRRINRII